MLHQVVFLVFLCLVKGDELARWSNKELEVIRTQDPIIGSPLVVAAKHRPGLTRTSCYLISPSPSNLYWNIIDGVVYDTNNNIVDGVEAWIDDEEGSTCGIKILEMTADHLETVGEGFNVFMIFEDLSLFYQPDLNTIKAIIHMTDEIEDRISPLDIPVHYDMLLLPDLLSTDPTISYTGAVVITQRVGHSSTGLYMYFHLDGPDIYDIVATGKRQGQESTENLNIIVIEYDLQANKIMVGANSAPLNTDDEVKLSIAFEANLSQRKNGLYKVLCRDNSEMYCWFTQFESTGARLAFPCVDEPELKATFSVQVGRQAGTSLSTLFNMPLEYSSEVDGVIWDHFKETPPMSTYLIALAIQDFVPVHGAGNVTIWADMEYVESGLAEYSADIGPRIIEFYSETFQIGYSLPKMDMVAVPGKGGAMENWGLILYQPSTLLYDQSSGDTEKWWRVAEVVAHELAHQWFGNLVTMDWWDQTWLNEGFASYVSHMGVDNIEPGLSSWGRMVVHRMFTVMKTDSTFESWAISDSVKNRKDIGRKFGSITYSKGASLIRMMEGILGANTLYKGLAVYLDNLQYDNAVEEDLFGYLEEAGLLEGTWPQPGHFSFENTMKTWTQQAGYPVVTVERLPSSLVLSQSWYRLDQPDSTEQVWDLPVNYVLVGPDTQTSDWEDISPMAWMTDVSLELNLPTDDSSPVVVNKLATAYYRVNYDTDNWMKISNILNTDHTAIHPLNRAQIICDIYSLFHTGHVTADIRDSVLGYLENETDFTPLLAMEECQIDLESLMESENVERI